MQTSPFTYDELTPLEQCIADFIARQQLRTAQRDEQTTKKKKRMLSS